MIAKGTLAKMTKAELAELERYAAANDDLWREAFARVGEQERRQRGAVWSALPGPQTMARDSLADITGFGGSAGGGKSDLACGLSTTQHRKVCIFRESGTELVAINDRLGEIIGDVATYNGRLNLWRFPRADGAQVQIELGSFPSVGDEKKYRGRPHDLLVFDEAQDMREKAVRFLMGWLRTTEPGQRCRVLMTFNPPESVEGRWLVRYFAPWLDKKHPKRALPGELRWFATIRGKDLEMPDARPFVLSPEGEPIYKFKESEHKADAIVRPLSRTFVPSRVTDNPYLMGTAYHQQLQSLEEPFRSKMLYGDFDAGMIDDERQVIPTEWVEAAQARWKKPLKLPPMDSQGVDVARGGKDQTIIANRHGEWIDELKVYAGKATPDGPEVAGLVIANRRDLAVIHIDVIGVGASPYDFLVQSGQQTIGVNVSNKATATDQSGLLRFHDLRSQLWWQAREWLDPQNNTGAQLPPGSEVLADLCAPTFQVKGRSIVVASRDEIMAKIGRSPDRGSAIIMALIRTPKRHVIAAITKKHRSTDPLDEITDQLMRRRDGKRYDPRDT